MTYDSSDPATIEQELAETRARLDSHLTELSNRLSPGQLVDDGLDYLRHGQGAQFAHNLGSQVRDNPLPVALTGIGLAWLVASSALSGPDASRRRVGAAPDDVAARARRAGDSLVRLTDEAEDVFKLRVAEARAQVFGLQREATEAGAAFVDRVQQALDSAQQSAREGLAAVGQTASEWSAAVTDRTQRTGEAVGQAARDGRDMALRTGAAIADTVNRNPMLLGALGLTAGVLLAALLPPTEQEEMLVAPVGGAIRQVAGEAVERGKRAAEAAAESAYQQITEP